MDTKRIGKYEILEKRGEGGFGVLYRAFDTVIEREIALKLLHRQLAAEEKFSAWFHREAKAMARLNHPNIVTIYNFEVIGEDHFIVMEFVDGMNVDEILNEKGPSSIKDMVLISRQLLSALGFAHKNGIIHRDIKPSNIMVTSTGLVKITDFGIAKILGSSKLTQTGTAAGSLPYMSPEQIRGAKNIDFRTDIYSLGITLYQMLSGKVPFKEDSDFLLMRAHLEKDPPPITDIRQDIPRGLEQILLKALEKNPEGRFTSTQEMSAALADFQKSASIDSGDDISLASEVYEKLSEEKTAIKPSEKKEEPKQDKDSDKTEFKPLPTTKKGPRPVLMLLAVIAVVVVIFVTWQVLSRPGEEEPVIIGDDTTTVAQADDKTDDDQQPIDIDADQGQQDTDTDQDTPAAPEYEGKLSISYSPFDYADAADVYLSGVRIPHNNVPISLDTLKPGQYTLLIKSRSRGNDSFFDTVTVSEKRQIRSYDFTGGRGKVRVSAGLKKGGSTDYIPANIYIDDRKTEFGTPHAFELLAGPHKISVKHDDYKPVRDYEIVYIEPFDDIRKFYDLRKK